MKGVCLNYMWKEVVANLELKEGCFDYRFT